MNKIKQFLKKIEDFLYDLYEFDKHMKKSILFLLIPIFSFGQDLVSSEDGIDIDLDFIGTTAGVTNLSKVQVNDTIMVGIDLNNLSAYEITYIHVDIEYNTAAFALVDQEWDVPDGAQESVFSWTNVKFTPDPNHPDQLFLGYHLHLQLYIELVQILLLLLHVQTLPLLLMLLLHLI